MAVRSFTELASSRDLHAPWASLLNSGRSFRDNPAVAHSVVQYGVEDQARLLLIHLHSPKNIAEIERLRCDLFALLFRSSDAELIAANKYLRQTDILTSENIDLRRKVSSCLFSQLPLLVSDLVKHFRFAESMAIVKLMPIGSDRDQVLRHISIGLANQGRLSECAEQIHQITGLSFGYATVGAVAKVLVHQGHANQAHNFLDTLPDKEKSRTMRELALKFADQGRSVEANAMANAIPLHKERQAALSDVAETDDAGIDCLKHCISGFAQCCQAIQILFRRCCRE